METKGRPRYIIEEKKGLGDGVDKEVKGRQGCERRGSDGLYRNAFAFAGLYNR